MTPAQAFDALYLECIPTRPTRPDPTRMSLGPTEQFRRLELARLAWALARCAPEENRPLLTDSAPSLMWQIDRQDELTIADVGCCAGLGADGYAAVGLAPHGFDIEDQPDYPYPFTIADGRDLIRDGALREFTASHFSWPCQEHTTAGHLRTAQGGKSRFGDLLTPGLALIREHLSDRPWIVENVNDRSGNVRRIMAPQPGEWLVNLCGSMFGLDVQRHRLFLANFPLRQPACDHSRFPLDPVTGKPRPWGVYHVKGDSIPSGGRTARDPEHGRHVMGSRRLLPWDKLKEGYPPAYSSHVGADLLVHLALSRRAQSTALTDRLRAVGDTLPWADVHIGETALRQFEEAAR